MPKKIFKLIASKAGKVVFEDCIKVTSEREARELMKSRLGLRSLAGVVCLIAEIPVELIRELVQAEIAEALNHGKSGQPMIGLRKFISEAVESSVDDKLRHIEQRLAAQKARGPKTWSAMLGPPAETVTNWRAVRTFYKKTRSPKRTAARFGIPVNTVKARVRRGNW